MINVGELICPENLLGSRILGLQGRVVGALAHIAASSRNLGWQGPFCPPADRRLLPTLYMKASADDDWAFYQHEQGRWSWHKRGVGVPDTGCRFTGIVEAVADAVHNGFKPGVSGIALAACRRSRPR
jgi:hypothetical protein